jgi:LysM repeat protein
VLKTHEASIRHHASQIQLTTVAEGDDWWQLSQRLGLPIVQLRMHNPFLANRQLRVGQLIAYPMAPRTDLFREFADGSLEYITRTGDNYFNIAFTLDVDLNDMRDENDLWRLQTLPVGLRLTLPTAWEAKHTVHTVRAGETVETIAENLKSQPWRIIRDNGIWNQDLQVGATLRVREVPPRPTYLVHRVTRGENLGAIARRYGTSVSAIQSTNSLGRRTLIRIGQQLRIPTLAADQ